MRLDAYMHLCLLHPQWGYYQRSTPIGTQGAFTTSPEISQMFGEVIGAWIQDLLDRLPACSSPPALVELGPGKGTLMSDVLRSLSYKKQYVHLIEQSNSFQKTQSFSLSKMCNVDEFVLMLIIFVHIGPFRTRYPRIRNRPFHNSRNGAGLPRKWPPGSPAHRRYGGI